MASVVKDELVARGVDPDRIIEEETSFNMVTQLIETIKLAVDNGWDKVALVANTWYFPRLGEFVGRLKSIATYEDGAQNAAFLAMMDRFEAMGGQISMISSEEVMCIAQPRFRALIAVAETALTDTVASEARGLKALRDGQYAVSLRLPS